MHAVLRVDLQFVAAVRALDEFVHPGRTVAGLRPSIGLEVDLHRHRHVLESQMGRLILLVIGVAQIDRTQPVESEHAVGLRIVDARAVGGRFEHGVVGHMVMHRPRRRLDADARQKPALDAGHQRAHQSALLEPLLEVARGLEFGVQPRLLERRGIGAEFVLRAPCSQRIGDGLRRKHAGLDRRMTALDARCVEKPRFAPHQTAAGKHQLGQAQQPAGRDGTRAVAQTLGAVEQTANCRMGLELLKFLERTHPRIGVIQPDHEADGHLAVFEVVEKPAAVSLGIERPARGVQHQPRLVFVGSHFPELLDANAVALRIAPGVELEMRDQLAAQLTARAFGEHRVLGAQFHAQREMIGRLAVPAQPLVACGHAANTALLVIEHLGRSEAGENLHAQRFSLLRHPAHQIAQADDVVAVVLETVGQKSRGRGLGVGVAQEQKLIRRDWLIQRRAHRLPVREQFGQRAGVHDGTGQNVRPRLGTFFQHADRDLAPGLLRQLLEMDGRSQSARARPDDDDVVIHGLARAEFFQELMRGHRGLHGQAVLSSILGTAATKKNDRSILGQPYFRQRNRAPRKNDRPCPRARTDARRSAHSANARRTQKTPRPGCKTRRPPPARTAPSARCARLAARWRSAPPNPCPDRVQWTGAESAPRQTP